MADFSTITPCGGDCEQCGFYHDGGCAGCRENSGKCVKMWDNGCAIFKCCEERGVYFCGICWEFPCEFLNGKLAEWDKNGIYKLKELAAEYREQQQKKRLTNSLFCDIMNLDNMICKRVKLAYKYLITK